MKMVSNIFSQILIIISNQNKIKILDNDDDNNIEYILFLFQTEILDIPNGKWLLKGP